MKGKRDHATSSSSSDHEVPLSKRSARGAAPLTSLGSIQDDIERETNVHELVDEIQHENVSYDEVSNATPHKKTKK